MIITERTRIIDSFLIKTNSFSDFRGEYFQTYNIDEYNLLDIEGNILRFKEDDISISYNNVLRGLHGDKNTWKLVQCLHGEIFFVMVDLRRNSPSYKFCETYILTTKKRMQILIPPGCVNGTYCMSDFSIFSYKQSEVYRGAENQISIRWDDPELNISWPTSVPILSDRDRTADFLNLNY